MLSRSCVPCSQTIDGPDFRNWIEAWDPEAMPADWEAGRQRYFTINWIQLGVTWAVFALFVLALSFL
jgi:hypothetical protein